MRVPGFKSKLYLKVQPSCWASWEAAGWRVKWVPEGIAPSHSKGKLRLSAGLLVLTWFSYCCCGWTNRRKILSLCVFLVFEWMNDFSWVTHLLLLGNLHIMAQGLRSTKKPVSDMYSVVFYWLECYSNVSYPYILWYRIIILEVYRAILLRPLKHGRC